MPAEKGRSGYCRLDDHPAAVLFMVQRLLFGVRRPELRYTDLLHAEFASLLIVVLVLLALGLAPTTLFASEGTPFLTATGESPTWTR